MKSDIFALLEENQAQSGTDATLPLINVWRAAVHYLMFFTLFPEKFVSHYDEESKTTFLCTGEADCLACAAGVKATEHIYLPTWDVQNRRIVVLKFDTREDGPARQILPFLKAYRNQLADVVAVLKCEGKGKFTITAHKPNPETDRGALQCREFCRALEAGAVNQKSCVKQLTAKEVAELASVKRAAVQVVGEEVVPAGEPVRVDEPAGEPVEPIDESKGE